MHAHHQGWHLLGVHVWCLLMLMGVRNVHIERGDGRLSWDQVLITFFSEEDLVYLHISSSCKWNNLVVVNSHSLLRIPELVKPMNPHLSLITCKISFKTYEVIFDWNGNKKLLKLRTYYFYFLTKGFYRLSAVLQPCKQEFIEELLGRHSWNTWMEFDRMKLLC